MGDRLSEMLRLQHDLQRESMGVDPLKLYAVDEPNVRIEYIKECVLAALDELHEALGETGWKTWAKSRHVNSDALFGELVDVWHFLMNLMLASGVANTPEEVATELYGRYVAKRKRNAQRQVEGYDGVTEKCPRCRRAYDDEHVFCRPKGDSDGSLYAWCDYEEVFI